MTGKLIWGAAIVVVAVVAWQWQRGEAATGPASLETASAEVPVLEAAEGAEEEALGVQQSVSSGREPVADESGPTELPLPPGSLDVQLLWDDDGSVAAGIWLDVCPREDPASRAQYLQKLSDASGRVHFPELHPGELQVVTDRGGFHELELEPGARQELILRIPKAELVRGTVVSAQGEPVGGAEVWAESVRRMWPNAKHVAVTAADGSFTLTGLTPETRLGARAMGHSPSLLFDVRDLPAGTDGSRSIELALEGEGGGLAGRVLLPDGRPAAGAKVQMGSKGGYIVDLPDGRRGEKATPIVVLADGEGRFESAAGLWPGEQTVRVLHRDHPLWTGTVSVRAGEVARLEAQLLEPAHIAGRVLDGEGKPVAGARIVAAVERNGGWYDHAFPPPRAESDESGRFELGLVTPGVQELNAYVYRKPELGRARTTLQCAAGEVTRVDLHLDVGATIAGRVLDEAGNPLADWGVYGRPFKYGSVYPRQVRTNEEGRFLLANLGDCDWALQVAAPGEFPHPPRAEVKQVAPGAKNVEIVVVDVIERTSRVHGLLLDENGSVPRDVTLVIYPRPGSTGNFIDLDPESGEFRYGPTAAGTYMIQLSRGNRVLGESEVFELSENENHDAGTLTVGRPGSIELEILGVPSAELEALGPRLDRMGHGTEELVLEGGSFRSPELLSGTWVLHTEESRWFLADHRIEIEPGGVTRISLEALPAAREMRVDCAFEGEGDDWQEIGLEVHDASGELVRTRGPWPRTMFSWGPDTTFRLGVLPEGTFDAVARTDSGASGEARFTVSRTAATPPVVITVR